MHGRSETTTSEALPASALACCLACGHQLKGAECCPTCGRPYPEREGILHAIGTLSGTNRIAADFYDGPNWARFRPWERLFLQLHGPGIAAARRQILRHLPRQEHALVLEVGIGDGENLPLLPAGWTAYGVDIARTQLEACRDRFPSMRGRLVWAEGEALPFPDGSFDAVYSVGGFNYFRDHAAALGEMRRVARPHAPVVVADEISDLYRLAPGHILGLEALDRWGLRRMGLEPEFIAMVFGQRLDINALARARWPGHHRFPIWHRLGYCLVDPDPREGCHSCP